MQKIIVGVKKFHEETFIVACDSECLGKTFREGKLKLEVSEEFYRGNKGTYEDLIKGLAIATMANLVGERTIECATKSGFIGKENVIRIQGIPHAQMIRMI